MVVRFAETATTPAIEIESVAAAFYPGERVTAFNDPGLSLGMPDSAHVEILFDGRVSAEVVSIGRVTLCDS